tara:strand:- start:54557 stop:55162 length:606 start_codon:yes stop_codon:yes gene_type:complete
MRPESSRKIKIAPLDLHFEDQLIAFTDLCFGARFYSKQDLRTVFEYSHCQGKNASLVAWDGTKIVGIRFTFAPYSNWDVLFGQNKILPENWGFPEETAAYFKTLSVHPDYQMQGLGSRLSRASIGILKEMKASCIVSHSWKESPGNSSLKYFSKMNFKPIGEHPMFWANIDYDCTLCKKPPCRCTSVEMIYPIEESDNIEE